MQARQRGLVDALSDVLHRMPIGSVLAELHLVKCLRHPFSCNSVRASSMHLRLGSSKRRRRSALSDARLRVSIGGVLTELHQLEHVRHPCGCNSARRSPMHFCVGSSGRRRRRALVVALRRMSIGGVLAELH
jgi:hypothetical protein